MLSSSYQKRLVHDQELESSEPAVLSSETYISRVMPQVLGTGDMIALFLLNVFWVTNITPIAAGGSAGFLYWVICGVTFFIPCSIVMAQLTKMYPHEGSIFNWTYHALGARWSFFVGICAWLPGILSIVNAAAAVVSLVQALNGKWLTETWQQGLAMLVLLTFTGILACQRTRTIKYVITSAAVLMGLATLIVVLATIFWMTGGHHLATNFTDASGWSIRPANFALLGSATLALLGSDMPLAMAGEFQQKRSRSTLSRHLLWATIFTLVGYVIFTFAVLAIQGANAAANTANPMALMISTVDDVFGKTMGNVMAICLGCYFLMIPVALHVCFSRMLLVASVDRRISIRFAKLNKQRVPFNSMVLQIVITLVAALIIYFLVPSISFLGQPANLSNIAYNVIGASLLLVWAFSFLFIFIDAVVLYFKQRSIFLQRSILPRSVLVPLIMVCAVLGVLLCLATIGFTLLNSFIPWLIPNSAWWYVIGGSALACIIIFAVFSIFTTSEVAWEELSQADQ